MSEKLFYSFLARGRHFYDREIDIVDSCKYWFSNKEDAKLFAQAYVPLTDRYHFAGLCLGLEIQLADDYLYPEEIQRVLKLIDSFTQDESTVRKHADYLFYKDDLIRLALSEESIPKENLLRIQQAVKLVNAPIFINDIKINASTFQCIAFAMSEMRYILCRDLLEIFHDVDDLQEKIKIAVSNQSLEAVKIEEDNFASWYFLEKDFIFWMIRENLLSNHYLSFKDEVAYYVPTISESDVEPRTITIKRLLSKLKNIDQYSDYDERAILQDALQSKFGIYLPIPPENINHDSYIRQNSDSNYLKRYAGYERIFPDLPSAPASNALSIRNFLRARPPQYNIMIEQEDPWSILTPFQVSTFESACGLKRSLRHQPGGVKFNIDDLLFIEDEINLFYDFNTGNKCSTKTDKIAELKEKIGLKNIKMTEIKRAGEIAKRVLNALAEEFAFDTSNPPRTRENFHNFLKGIDPTFNQSHETLRRKKTNTILFKHGAPSPTEDAKWKQIFTTYGLTFPPEN